MNYVVVGYWQAGYCESDSFADLAGQLQDPAPGAIIELFQLQLNVAQHGVDATYYFHPGLNERQQPITWQGQEYMPLPIEAEGFAWTGQGSLPRPVLRVSNLMGTITTLLLTLPRGLDGAKVTRIRTLGRYLDSVNFSESTFAYVETGYWDVDYTVANNPYADPLAEWPREIYFVDRKAAETRELVELELASALDLVGVRAPRRQCVTRCTWEYRSTECGYAGTAYFDAGDQPVANASQDVCGKRVESCKKRFGQNAELPYGGFVGIGTYFV